MATGICNTISKSVASRKCVQSGGVKNKAWIGQVEDFVGAKTYNTGGALSSFTLAAGANFITATGRPLKGSGASALAQPVEGGVSNEQTVILEFIYNNQEEANAIMAIMRADGLTVFLETNAGTIRQFFAEFGSTNKAGEDGTGTTIADASGVFKLTVKGTETDLPLFFEAVNTAGLVTQLQASKDYLDALVTG
jgi:hypothetical protein